MKTLSIALLTLFTLILVAYYYRNPKCNNQNKLINTIWSIIVPTILLLVLLLLITYLLVLSKSYIFKSGYDSMIGSFVGGVFGAFVSFVVAKTQISYDKRNKQEKETKTMKAYIISLLSEQKMNLLLIDRILKNCSNEKISIPPSIPLSSEIWNTIKVSPIFVESINSKYYEQLSAIYQQFAFFKSGGKSEYLTKQDLMSLCKSIQLIINEMEIG